MKSWFYFVIPDSFQIVQCLLPKARSVLASSKSGNASARVGHHVNRDPFFCRTWAHRTSYTTVNHVQCACRWQNHSWIKFDWQRDWIQPDLPSLGKEVETTRQVQFESCQETDLTIWRSFPTCRSPLHYVHLTCFVRCNCDGMSDVTRDNYHCCCIYAGELALNSLVLWMLVKHYDPL